MRHLIKNNYCNLISFLKKRPALKILFWLFILSIINLSVYRVIIYMSDFNMFIDPAIDAKFFHKDPITHWTNNSYSPFFYAIMSFFSIFSRWFAVILWSLISLAGLFIVFSISIELIQKNAKHHPLKITLILLSLSTVLIDNFQLGQCNIIVLTLIVLSIYYDNKGKNIKSSFFLGFAIAFKLLPLVLIGYFILQRKYKTALLSLYFAICLTLFLPLIIFPFGEYLQYLDSWFNHVFISFLTKGEVKTSTISFYHTNQSLEAFLGRYFTSYGEENYHTSLLSLVKLTSKNLNLISLSLKTIFIASISLLFWKKNNGGSLNYPIAGFFLYGVIIISPVAWANYYVFLIPVIITFILKVKLNNKPLIALFSIGCLLIILDVNPFLQSLSLHFIGGIIIFLATYLLLWKNTISNPSSF